MFCNDALNWNTHTDRFITIFQIFTKWQLQTFVMPIHLQHHQQEENFKFCNLLQNYLITDMLLVKWNHETLMNISKNFQTLNFGPNPSKFRDYWIIYQCSVCWQNKIMKWRRHKCFLLCVVMNEKLFLMIYIYFCKNFHILDYTVWY